MGGPVGGLGMGLVNTVMVGIVWCVGKGLKGSYGGPVGGLGVGLVNTVVMGVGGV